MKSLKLKKKTEQLRKEQTEDFKQEEPAEEPKLEEQSPYFTTRKNRLDLAGYEVVAPTPDISFTNLGQPSVGFKRALLCVTDTYKAYQKKKNIKKINNKSTLKEFPSDGEHGKIIDYCLRGIKFF